MSEQYSEAEINKLVAVKKDIRAGEAQDRARYLQLADLVLDHLKKENASEEECAEMIAELSAVKGDEVEVGRWLDSEIVWQAESLESELTQLEA
jgi:hypothetical protein